MRKALNQKVGRSSAAPRGEELGLDVVLGFSCCPRYEMPWRIDALRMYGRTPSGAYEERRAHMAGGQSAFLIWQERLPHMRSAGCRSRCFVRITE